MNLLFCLISTISSAFASGNNQNYQVGDVIMQSDKFEGPAIAIKLLTASKFNHVGVVIEKNNKLYVAEALSTVKYTPVEVYVKRGEDYRHLRFKKELTDKEKEQINKSVKKYMGKKYDPFLSWSDDRMYCSELVVKAFEDIGVGVVTKKGTIASHSLIAATLPAIKSGAIKVPDLYKKSIDQIKLSDTIVTPADINRSSLLKEVRY